MNLTELKTLGACIDATPEKTVIEWKGHSVDVWVKRLAFGDVERLMALDGGSKSAAMLAASILLGEDKEPLTLVDAERLDVTLAGKLIEAINGVNGELTAPN